jgi:hypothetical protein
MCNIVAALRRVTKTPFVVAVAGDGYLMTALKKFIARENLENSFRILGAVSLARIARLHNASDIFLLPSLIEGIALALYEAMALESVPVVADVGGQRELVTADCGYLIPPGETSAELTAYVAALKQLLEKPELRRQKALACRLRVQNHFSLSHMTKTFIASMDEAGWRLRQNPVRLPEAQLCREVATMAMDYVRVTQESAVRLEHGCLLQDRVTKNEKIMQRLYRQIEAARSPQLTQEANEFAA